MKKAGSIIASIVILLLLCSGAFADILKFFAWLFALQYSQPDTSADCDVQRTTTAHQNTSIGGTSDSGDALT